MTGRLVVYILAGFSVVCFTAVFLIGAVRRLRSRGEEAGVAEHSDDEMAIARAVGVDLADPDWQMWEAEMREEAR